MATPATDIDTGGGAASAPSAPPPTTAPVRSAPVDGRTARAQRTRDAIVEACVTLVNAGDIRPTAPRIAGEAGVSVRSVFQHFDDLETLFALVSERALDGLAGLVRPIDVERPLAERLDSFAEQRAELLEAVTPIRRAAAVHAPFSPTIQQRVAAGHDFFRGQLATVFARELEPLSADRREQVLDMLDVAASWSAWEVLRTLDGRSVVEARAVLTSLLVVILGVAS